MRRKAQTAVKFQACEAIWTTQDFPKASECYDQARNLYYLTDSLDSLIYNRTEAVQEMSDAEHSIFSKVDSALVLKDTVKAWQLLGNLSKTRFLDTAQVRRLHEWQAMVKPSVDTVGRSQPK